MESITQIPNRQGRRDRNPVAPRLVRSLVAAAVLLATALAPTASGSVYRELTSVEGKTITARVISVKGDEVTLVRKGSARSFVVKLDQFAKDDRELLASFREDEPGPPPKPAGPPEVVDDRVYDESLYPLTLRDIVHGMWEIKERSRKGDFNSDLKAALAELNTFRLLSGVPTGVTLNRDFIAGAYSAAEACAEANTLDHGLNEGAKNSNLAMGNRDIVAAVHGWMRDFGENNRERQGHRRWCLYPRLNQTGFGYASGGKRFYAMWAMDHSNRKAKVGHPFFGFPGRGLYPAAYFHPRAMWTVYLSDRTRMPGDARARVFEVPAEAGLSDREAFTKGKKLRVSYQTTHAESLIFKPEGISTEPGKRYWVVVDGAPVKIEYLVEFCRLDEPTVD